MQCAVVPCFLAQFLNRPHPQSKINAKINDVYKKQAPNTKRSWQNDLGTKLARAGALLKSSNQTPKPCQSVV
jgi:hypothetical protein